jgi:hypothetical protein
MNDAQEKKKKKKTQERKYTSEYHFRRSRYTSDNERVIWQRIHEYNS